MVVNRDADAVAVIHHQDAVAKNGCCCRLVKVPVLREERPGDGLVSATLALRHAIGFYMAVPRYVHNRDYVSKRTS